MEALANIRRDDARGIAARSSAIASGAAAAGGVALALAARVSGPSHLAAAGLVTVCSALVVAALLRRDRPRDVRGAEEWFRTVGASCGCTVAATLAVVGPSEPALVFALLASGVWSTTTVLLVSAVRAARTPRAHTSPLRALVACAIWMTTTNAVLAVLAKGVLVLLRSPSAARPLWSLVLEASGPALVVALAAKIALTRKRRFVRAVAEGKVPGWVIVPSSRVPTEVRGALLHWDVGVPDGVLGREVGRAASYRDPPDFVPVALVSSS